MLTKPYRICWFAILLLILIGFIYRDTPLDIQLYDTYYIVGAFHFVLIGSIILFLVGFGYWLLDWQSKQPNKFLMVLHLAFTIGVLCLVLPVAGSTDKSVLIGLFWAALVFLPLQAGFALYLLINLLRR